MALGIYDVDELDILVGTVVHKTYRMKDANFIDWSDYAFKISIVLGLIFWKSKAVECQMRHGVRGAALVADDERIDESMAARERVLIADVIAVIPKAQSDQKAALEALRTLAQENSFQLEDCLKLADIAAEEIDQLEGVESDSDRLDYFLTNLREIAPSG